MKLLDGDTLHAKSIPHWWAVEESGDKPYTMRLADESEVIAADSAKFIYISNTSTGSTFTRTITHVWHHGIDCGLHRIVIQWDPAER